MRSPSTRIFLFDSHLYLDTLVLYYSNSMYHHVVLISLPNHYLAIAQSKIEKPKILISN